MRTVISYHSSVSYEFGWFISLKSTHMTPEEFKNEKFDVVKDWHTYAHTPLKLCTWCFPRRREEWIRKTLPVTRFYEICRNNRKLRPCSWAWQQSNQYIYSTTVLDSIFDELALYLNFYNLFHFKNFAPFILHYLHYYPIQVTFTRLLISFIWHY